MSSFSFGKNWQSFLHTLDREKVETAKWSLKDFLGLENFQGKTFLDIGCGSGLFSLAAYELGAKEIISFDSDPYSVACCKELFRMTGSPTHWKILEGSILDQEFLKTLPKADIVYAWGVLHHTGNLWAALKNAASLVNSQGYLYLAIYNKVSGILGSPFWEKIKKSYYSASPAQKKVLEYLYRAFFFIAQLLKGKNPIKTIREYKIKRGMSFGIDVIDWLGGYPYEYASYEETIAFLRGTASDFMLLNGKPTDSLGNHWFLFQKETNIQKRSPFLSIIIPTFNRAYCLPKALESVLSESFHDSEIIVVDDGSTDGTESLVKTFHHPQLRFFRLEKNQGVNRARNFASEQARGEWLIFLDSDDALAPGALIYLANLGSGTSRALLFSASQDLDGVIRSSQPFFEGDLGSESFMIEGIRGEYLPMVKREVFLRAGKFLDDIQGGESLTWKKIAMISGGVSMSARVTRHYNHRGLDRLSIKSQKNKERLFTVFEKDLKLYGAYYRKHRPILYGKKLAKRAYYSFA